jgi:hypothetical protein
VIAVFGRTLRAGRWKVADDSLVIAVFGRCVLDLTRAYVDEDADDELTMSVFSLFGSVSILLPPGCDVEPSGVAIAASSAVEIPSEKQRDVTSDVLAPFDISWIALFAKVRIAEIAPDLLDQTARRVLAVPSGPAAIERSVLEPPAVEVFDATSASASAPPVDAEVIESEPEVAAPSPTAVDDAESEAATLRDEIAQWRAESGRGPSTDAEANDDADDAIPEIVG